MKEKYMKKLLICALLSAPCVSITSDQNLSTEQLQEKLIDMYLENRVSLADAENINQEADKGTSDEMICKYANLCADGVHLDLKILHGIQTGDFEKKCLNQEAIEIMAPVKAFSREHSIPRVPAALYIRTLGKFMGKRANELQERVNFRTAFTNGIKSGVEECLEENSEYNAARKSDDTETSESKFSCIDPVGARLFARLLLENNNGPFGSSIGGDNSFEDMLMKLKILAFLSKPSSDN